MRKVKITGLPKAQSGLEVKTSQSLNSSANPQWFRDGGGNSNRFSKPAVEVNHSLKPVDRRDANLEAELGETAFTDLTGDGIPQLYKIGGERHYNGGTPLDLPEDSFIYSRDNKMKIGGPILESFGKSKDTKKKYTPADISKQYPINDYRKILADPDSDKLQRDTAELMIANYNLKLAKLGLVQESQKGFPDGIPAIAMPYIETMGVNPQDFISPQGMPDQPAADNVAKYGKTLLKAQLGYTSEAEYKKHLTDPYSKEKAQNQMIWNVAHPVVNNEEQDYTKQLQELSTLEEQSKKWAQEQKANADYRAALNISKQKQEDIEDAKYDAANIDAKIKENLNFQKEVLSGQRLGKGYYDIDILREELMDLTSKQKAKLNIINQIESKPTQKATSPWTIKDYQKSLLDKKTPYAEKHKAQMDFLATNPENVDEKYTEIANKKYITPQSSGSEAFDIEQTSKIAQTDVSTSQPISTDVITTNTAQPQITPTTDTVINTSSLKNLSDAEFNALDERIKSGKIKPIYKKYGGLVTYQGTDNASTVADPMAEERKRRAQSKTTTKGTGKPKVGTTENFDAYGVIPPEMISKYLTEEQQPFIRKESVKGQQSKTSEGIYGEGVSVADFLKRNPKWAAKNPGFDSAKGTKKQFQSVYNKHVYQVAYEDAIAKGYPETEAKDLAKAWVTTQGFKEGTPVAGDPRYQDDAFGEFTSSRFEPSFKPYKAPTKTGEPETEDNVSPLVTSPVGPEYKTPGPEFWLQDKIKNLGAFSDLMRIKKYPPWQATPAVAYGERTFFDPTRELAANAEQVNLGVQGASTFSGPQSFAATAAYLQGQGADNAANTMGRYSNMNVEASNQLSDMNTDIFNRAAQQRAANATQLFDKRTIVNQQFDNSKNLARQNLRQSFIDSLTNRANTYNLNTLYPQYAVSPGTGGMTYNVPGSNRQLDPNYKKPETPEEAMKRIQLIPGLRDAQKDAIFDAMFGKGATANKTQDQGYEKYQTST